MEGLKDLVAALQAVLPQLETMLADAGEGDPSAPEETEEMAPEAPAAPEAAAPGAGGDDSFKDRKGMMVAMLRKSLPSK